MRITHVHDRRAEGATEAVPSSRPPQSERRNEVYSKAFTLKPDAERWAREQERSIELHGLHATFKEYQRVPVSELITRYLEKIALTRPAM